MPANDTYLAEEEIIKPILMDWAFQITIWYLQKNKIFVWHVITSLCGSVFMRIWFMHWTERGNCFSKVHTNKTIEVVSYFSFWPLTDGDDYHFVILSIFYRTFKQSYKTVLQNEEINTTVTRLWKCKPEGNRSYLLVSYKSWQLHFL